MTTTENRARTELYRRATEEWEFLKKTHRDTWAKYKVIGEAMVDARTEIMRERGLNEPKGPGYQQDIMAWLTEHKLDDMHKTTRSHLCDLIEHISEVDEMMADWSLTDRMEWNAPNTVHRKWQEWRRKKGHTSQSQHKRLNAAKQTSEQLAMALERVQELEQELQSAKATPSVTGTTAVVPVEPTSIGAALTTPPTDADFKIWFKSKNAGEIVDLILELKVSTQRAIAHDLFKEAGQDLLREPAKSKKSKSAKGKPTKKKKPAE